MPAEVVVVASSSKVIGSEVRMLLEEREMRMLVLVQV